MPGLFHGAGGIAHLFAVVPALGFPGVALPALYLSGYALGSLTLITAFAIGVGTLSQNSKPKLRRGVRLCGSLASVVVGIVWAVGA